VRRRISSGGKSLVPFGGLASIFGRTSEIGGRDSAPDGLEVAFTEELGFGVCLSGEEEREEKGLLLLVAEKNDWWRKMRRGGRTEIGDEREMRWR